jgi:hypothetical protein
MRPPEISGRVTKMSVIRRRRKLIAIAVAFTLACIGGGGLWYLYATEDVNPYPMKAYTSDVQEKAAKGIVAGLNTHNPDKVELFRIDGQPESDAYSRAITANIVAVLPPPNCQYGLVGIEDKGEQDPAPVSWYSRPSRARGFDMKLQQICPGKGPTPRTIRVIAIPSGMGGYWAEAALVEQPN